MISGPARPPTAPGIELVPLPKATCPAPTWEHATILDHRHRTDRYHHLRLAAAGIASACQAGQFVMLTVSQPGTEGPVLPRPMAVYSRDPVAGTIDIVYGVLGAGTRRLTTFRVGDRVLVVGPLGVGFRIDDATRRVLLVGRGIGTCSLTTVAQDAARRPGMATVAVASGRTAESVIGGGFYRAHGAERVFEVTDAAGSSSVRVLRNRLTRTLDPQPPQQILTCGSDRLARLCASLGQRWRADVQVCVEAHMACGLGYCHGCASEPAGGAEEGPLICVDGPVFRVRLAHGEPS